MPTLTRDAQKAIGLYIVLARDTSDFIDLVHDAPNETLQTLHEMLTYVGPTKSEHDIKLNSIGADLVAGVLKNRGVEPRYATPNLPPFED